jgi:NAD(P)-dependent dehydrogenase (short-subunit alcohol dehydrogenase family)
MSAALVTGGARGIGRAIAETLAGRGDRTTVADIDLDEAETTAAELRERGLNVHAVALDVTDTSQISEVFQQVDGEESLTTVVCNAGIGFITALVDTTEEEYDRLMAVNVKGVFFVMQAALRRMVPRGSGSVVVISSTSGFTSSTKPMAIYDASKAAVKMFTVSAAREVAESGVRVNAVAPGTVGTDLIKAIMSPEAQAKLIDDRIPYGRLAEPKEIADAVEFLSSERAAYVTGHTLVVDGGWLT